MLWVEFYGVANVALLFVVSSGWRGGRFVKLLHLYELCYSRYNYTLFVIVVVRCWPAEQNRTRHTRFSVSYWLS